MKIFKIKKYLLETLKKNLIDPNELDKEWYDIRNKNRDNFISNINEIMNFIDKNRDEIDDADDFDINIIKFLDNDLEKIINGVYLGNTLREKHTIDSLIEIEHSYIGDLDIILEFIDFIDKIGN